jgi:hypothetical protein
MGLDRRDRSVDIDLRSKISTHRVERDAHAALFLSFDERAALIVAAVRTDHMGRLGRAALRTVLQLDRLDGVVTPPPAATHLRTSPLGNSHRSFALTLELVVSYSLPPQPATAAGSPLPNGEWYGTPESHVKHAGSRGW